VHVNVTVCNTRCDKELHHVVVKGAGALFVQLDSCSGEPLSNVCQAACCRWWATIVGCVLQRAAALAGPVGGIRILRC